MMRVWIASFFVLFGVAELYQWLKHFTLPLPVYILGGAFLAIASNYEKIPGFPFQAIEVQDQPVSIKSQTPSMPPQPPEKLPASYTQPVKPISFTIRKSISDQPGA